MIIRGVEVITITPIPRILNLVATPQYRLNIYDAPTNPASETILQRTNLGFFIYFLKIFLNSEKILLRVQYSTNPEGLLYKKNKNKIASTGI